MYVVVVDIFALALLAVGISLVIRSSRTSGATSEPTAGVYGRRIGGTMLAALGLALGLMVTLFHFASVA